MYKGELLQILEWKNIITEIKTHWMGSMQQGDKILNLKMKPQKLASLNNKEKTNKNKEKKSFRNKTTAPQGCGGQEQKSSICVMGVPERGEKMQCRNKI